MALKKALADTPAPGKIDGFTPEQRYFLAFAQVWRDKLRPAFLRFKVTRLLSAIKRGEPHGLPFSGVLARLFKALVTRSKLVR